MDANAKCFTVQTRCAGRLFGSLIIELSFACSSAIATRATVFSVLSECCIWSALRWYDSLLQSGHSWMIDCVLSQAGIGLRIVPECLAQMSSLLRIDVRFVFLPRHMADVGLLQLSKNSIAEMPDLKKLIHLKELLVRRKLVCACLCRADRTASAWI